MIKVTKRTNRQEDKIILNLYVPNNMVTSVYKEKLIFKEEICQMYNYTVPLDKSSKAIANTHSIQAHVEQNKN